MDRNRSYTSDDYEEEEFENGPSYDQELDFNEEPVGYEPEADFWENTNDEEEELEE